MTEPEPIEPGCREDRGEFLFTVNSGQALIHFHTDDGECPLTLEDAERIVAEFNVAGGVCSGCGEVHG